MKINHYGIEDGKRGLEASYALDNGTLYIKIPGSNHILDYLACLFAWPRIRMDVRRYHRVWYRYANDLLAGVALEHKGVNEIKIIAHSMGGAVAAILTTMLPVSLRKSVTVINAPKCGNRAAMWALRLSGADIHCLYDSGDVVRLLPLFYTNYPLRSRRSYGRTRGIGKAHNHKPPEWGDFPI